jgi:predicted nucleic acid-binding protein
MKVIADTNIIISALINAKGKESDIILTPSYELDKYTCYFLYDEIQKHKGKIFRAAGINETAFLDVYFTITKRIKFINEEQIPESIWKKAFLYTTDIDEDDTPFIALALYLDGYLWTGDKKLIRGVSARGFKKILTTNMIIKGSF